MFKKIVGFLLALCVAFALTGCSQKEEPIQPVEPTKAPAAVYNVGQNVGFDMVSFVIRQGNRVEANVDKAHVVYGIRVVIRNNDTIEVPFKVSDIACFAGNERVEIYTGFTDALVDTMIPAKSGLDGWIYYKIPAKHDGLSFAYIYDEKGNYILFTFEEG
jgi:hypothetical protein